MPLGWTRPSAIVYRRRHPLLLRNSEGVLSHEGTWALRHPVTWSPTVILFCCLFRPYHTLLFLVDEGYLVASLPGDCSPAVTRLVRMASPLKRYVRAGYVWNLRQSLESLGYLENSLKMLATSVHTLRELWGHVHWEMWTSISSRHRLPCLGTTSLSFINSNCKF